LVLWRYEVRGTEVCWGDEENVTVEWVHMWKVPRKICICA
jgi:hypothetical protein